MFMLVSPDAHGAMHADHRTRCIVTRSQGSNEAQLALHLAELKQQTLQSFWKLFFSGVCLASHFSSWVWGIKHTSLVCSSPLLDDDFLRTDAPALRPRSWRLDTPATLCTLAAVHVMSRVVVPGACLFIRQRDAAGHCSRLAGHAQAHLDGRGGRDRARRGRGRSPGTEA